MHTDPLIIIGAGGHSKVVVDAIECAQLNYTLQLCDDSPALLGTEIMGLSIQKIPISLEASTDFTHIAIGNNRVRKLFGEKLSPALFMTIIHPTAVISRHAHMSNGIFIAAQATLAPYCHIGKGCIINHGAIIDHDVSIGAYSHIAPNATLGGQVSIGEGVLIGANATILPGIQIGNGAIVGAGSVVTKHVADNTTVKGVPAR